MKSRLDDSGLISDIAACPAWVWVAWGCASNYATFLWMDAPPAGCDLDRLPLWAFDGRNCTGAGATISSGTSHDPRHRGGVHGPCID